MARNTNCLENIQCPHCGNTSRFRIVSLVSADVSDDGAEFHGDAEWDGNSPITCPECDHTGTVRQFCPAAAETSRLPRAGRRRPRQPAAPGGGGEAMTQPTRIRIIDIAYHRNGMCGAPFHVVLFHDTDDENTRKLGILFEEPYHCAVLDDAKLARGEIAFGVNSYRGDRFETVLRPALKSNR
jgi:hypothetical protein